MDCVLAALRCSSWPSVRSILSAIARCARAIGSSTPAFVASMTSRADVDSSAVNPCRRYRRPVEVTTSTVYSSTPTDSGLHRSLIRSRVVTTGRHATQSVICSVVVFDSPNASSVSVVNCKPWLRLPITAYVVLPERMMLPAHAVIASGTDVVIVPVFAVMSDAGDGAGNPRQGPVQSRRACDRMRGGRKRPFPR